MLCYIPDPSLRKYLSTDLEKVLVDIGAVSHNDPRMQTRNKQTDEAQASSSRIRQGKTSRTNNGDNDDDSDWD